MVLVLYYFEFMYCFSRDKRKNVFSEKKVYQDEITHLLGCN